MFNVTGVLSHDHSDVTIFSPATSPGISDDPVSFSFVITNIDDGMVIRAVRAARIIKDSTVITLEVAVGININGVGSIVVDGFSQFFDSNILDIVGMISRDGVLLSTLTNLASMSLNKLQLVRKCIF